MMHLHAPTSLQLQQSFKIVNCMHIKVVCGTILAKFVYSRHHMHITITIRWTKYIRNTLFWARRQYQNGENNYTATTTLYALQCIELLWPLKILKSNAAIWLSEDSYVWTLLNLSVRWTTYLKQFLKILRLFFIRHCQISPTVCLLQHGFPRLSEDN